MNQEFEVSSIDLYRMLKPVFDSFGTILCAYESKTERYKFQRDDYYSNIWNHYGLDGFEGPDIEWTSSPLGISLVRIEYDDTVFLLTGLKSSYKKIRVSCWSYVSGGLRREWTVNTPVSFHKRMALEKIRRVHSV